MESLPYHWMRPKKAAAHFGIGVSTYWLWVKTRPGFPKPLKVGARTTIVDIAATTAYLQSASGVQQ